jgi:hypothetical protein
VVEPARDLGLAEEARGGLRVRGDPRGEDLEGHLSLERVLPCLVNDAHAAPAELPAQRVVAEGARGLRDGLEAEAIAHLDVQEHLDLAEDPVRKVRVLRADLFASHPLAGVDPLDVMAHEEPQAVLVVRVGRRGRILQALIAHQGLPPFRGSARADEGSRFPRRPP